MLLSTLLDQISIWDTTLFRAVNIEGSNQLFDWILPLWRNRNLWFPFYALLLILVAYKFKKAAIPWILFAALAPSLGDLFSSHVLKPFFDRPRPCSVILDVILRADYCPGNGSFPSSHAVNHFALAVFFWLTLRTRWPRFAWLFLIWAVIVCYAQIYVGVHYPFDVLAGAAIGGAIGWFCYWAFSRMAPKYFPFFKQKKIQKNVGSS